MFEKHGEMSEEKLEEIRLLEMAQADFKKTLQFENDFQRYRDLEFSEIPANVPDKLLGDPRACYSKWVPLTIDHLQPEDLQLNGTRPEMLRVLPTPLPILDEEIKWVMPFSVDDIMWDHSNFDLKTTVNFYNPKPNRHFPW